MKAPPARINTVVHLRAPRANSLSCALSFGRWHVVRNQSHACARPLSRSPVGRSTAPSPRGRGAQEKRAPTAEGARAVSASVSLLALRCAAATLIVRDVT